MIGQRIAILSDAVYPYHRGGKETRIYELGSRLAAAGYQVDVYTMKWWPEAQAPIHAGMQYHAVSRLVPLYRHGRRSILQALWFALASLKLCQAQFDVLEVDHMPFFPLYAGRLVCWIKRKPLVATWHEVWGLDVWLNYLGPAGIIAALIERVSVLLPNRIIAVSRHTQERLISQLHCHKPISVVANGINTADFLKVSADKENQSDIIYVGRLIAHKNLDLLLEALWILAPTHPNIKLMIVGDGPEREALVELTQELGLQAHVTFTGRVADDRAVAALRKASKVFALPSSREGYGIAVIEALADGLRVVTSNHTDNAARYLVSPEVGETCDVHPEAIASALERLLPLPPRTNHQLAEQYEWRHSADQLLQEYAL